MSLKSESCRNLKKNWLTWSTELLESVFSEDGSPLEESFLLLNPLRMQNRIITLNYITRALNELLSYVWVLVSDLRIDFEVGGQTFSSTPSECALLQRPEKF